MSISSVGSLAFPSGLLLLLSTAAAAQAPSSAPAKPQQHPPVCARGVRVYTDRSEIPLPYDTLAVPPADAPVQVHSPQEAEAAELALRGRAGSVGATGVLVIDETTQLDGGVRVRRRSVGVYVPADSAHAANACKS